MLWKDDIFTLKVSSRIMFKEDSLQPLCPRLGLSENKSKSGAVFLRFAHKLRAAGRLLEFVCIPGAKHGSGMMPHYRWKLDQICEHLKLLPSGQFGSWLVKPGGWQSKSTSSRTEKETKGRTAKQDGGGINSHLITKALPNAFWKIQIGWLWIYLSAVLNSSQRIFRNHQKEML